MLLAACAQQVNDEASDKVLQIEVEYNQKRQPIYRERSKLLRRLPNFWQTVLMQQETLCELIHEDDEEALFYCEDVRASFPLKPTMRMLPSMLLVGTLCVFSVLVCEYITM